jgi:peptidoglycan hydrolase-like protein with peptidoglycan-binding domain
MANEPTLRPGDQSVDGWVEYLQTQLKLLGGSMIGMPDSYQPTGVFDADTERYVLEFQRQRGVQADGVVGDETWNVLHGNVDNLDPHADGRQPHSYVEQTPRLEWENDGHYDPATESYTYVAMNVGQAPITTATATVRVTQGPVGLRADHCIGWTDSGQPAAPGQAMKFTFWLERRLTRDEEVEVELRLPDENGGASFAPGLTGYLEAWARGEQVD